MAAVLRKVVGGDVLAGAGGVVPRPHARRVRPRLRERQWWTRELDLAVDCGGGGGGGGRSSGNRGRERVLHRENRSVGIQELQTETQLKLIRKGIASHSDTPFPAGASLIERENGEASLEFRIDTSLPNPLSITDFSPAPFYGAKAPCGGIRAFRGAYVKAAVAEGVSELRKRFPCISLRLSFSPWSFWIADERSPRTIQQRHPVVMLPAEPIIPNRPPFKPASFSRRRGHQRLFQSPLRLRLPQHQPPKDFECGRTVTVPIRLVDDASVGTPALRVHVLHRFEASMGT
nr:arogenate dehydratase/prephenate dehydratase 6, chloroplastic-like [Ipomoea batatas]